MSAPLVDLSFSYGVGPQQVYKDALQRADPQRAPKLGIVPPKRAAPTPGQAQCKFSPLAVPPVLCCLREGRRQAAPSPDPCLVLALGAQAQGALSSFSPIVACQLCAMLRRGGPRAAARLPRPPPPLIFRVSGRARAHARLLARRCTPDVSASRAALLWKIVRIRRVEDRLPFEHFIDDNF